MFRFFIASTFIFLGCFLVIYSQENSGNKSSSSLYLPANRQQALKAQEALDVIQGQLQALRDHDIDKAYFAFTSQDFRNSTSRDEFQRFIFGNDVLGKNLRSDFRDPVFQDNIIIIQGVFVSIDDHKNIIEYALSLENGQWKILGIKVFPPS